MFYTIAQNEYSIADIDALKSEYRLNISTKSYDKAYKNAQKIMQVYESNYKFDSVMVYNKILSILGTQLGDADKYVKPLVDNLSIEVVLTRGIDSLLARVEEIYKYADDKSVEAFTRTTICHHMATAKLGVKEYGVAEAAIKKAIAISHEYEIKKTTRLDYEILLADVYRRQNKLVASLDVLFAADNELDNTVGHPVIKSRVYRALYRTLTDIDDIDKAYIYAEKNLKIGEENNLVEIKTEAYRMLGKALISQGKYTESIEKLKESIGLLKGSKFDRGIFLSHLFLAKAYLDFGQFSEAKTTLDDAEKYKKNDEYGDFVDSHNRLLARYFIETGQPDRGKVFLDKVNSIYRSKSYLNYLYYKAVGESAKSLQFFELYNAERDSIKSINQEYKVQSIESAYNRDIQDAAINNLTVLNIQQDKSLAIKNTSLIIGGVMLVFLFGLLFGLYRLYIRNRKNKNVLAAQNVEISEALSQNKILIREIHHRVKNNLQVVSSLLNMQARKLEDGDTKNALNSSKTRVQSMSILHQNLYQGNDITGVEISEYLRKLIANIVDTYKVSDSISVSIDIDAVSLDVDTLVPLGLIANELICNAFKYAFKDRESGKILISFKMQSEHAILTVYDDGVGFEGDTIPMKKGSLGGRLIYSFADRLEGDININKTDGTEISVIFPITALGII